MTHAVLDRAGTVMQAIFQGAVSNVNFTGTAGLSGAFASATRAVRLSSTSDCYYVVSQAGATTATTSNGSLLAAGAIEYTGVNPGDKISVIQVSSAGTLNITEAA